MRRILFLACGLVILIGAPVSAFAQDAVLAQLDEFIKRTTDRLDDNLLFGRMRLRPEFRQTLEYDSNIYQNPRRSTDTGKVPGVGPERMTVPINSRDAWDFISKSSLTLGLTLPVNEEYFKWFDKGQVNVLAYNVDHFRYLRHHKNDSFDQNFTTEFFGFAYDLLPELFSWDAKGRHWYMETKFDWSDITDPLDIQIYDLKARPVVWKQRSDFRRTEMKGHARVGYRGNHTDWWVQYRYYRLTFEENLYNQADSEQHSVSAEFGVRDFGALAQKRLYTRYSLTSLRYLERQLNDAYVHRAVLGLEGQIFTKKLDFLVEAGGVAWDTRDSSKAIVYGPTIWDPEDPEFENKPNFKKLPTPSESYCALIGRMVLTFTPWPERASTRFRLMFERDPHWSAIANYRVDHSLILTADHELIEKKLLGTAHVAWSMHEPDFGPRRQLLEIGFRLVLKLLDQVDLTAEYTFRKQASREEVVSPAVVDEGPPAIVQWFKTNGNFVQHVLRIGFAVRF